MHTYVKLKNGLIYIVWSDNEEEKTMYVYPLSEEHSFDAELDQLSTIKYSDIDQKVQIRYC